MTFWERQKHERGGRSVIAGARGAGDEQGDPEDFRGSATTPYGTVARVTTARPTDPATGTPWITIALRNARPPGRHHRDTRHVALTSVAILAHANLRHGWLYEARHEVTGGAEPARCAHLPLLCPHDGGIAERRFLRPRPHGLAARDCMTGGAGHCTHKKHRAGG